MHDLNTLNRLNEEAVQRHRATVPDGSTHLVVLKTGLNVVGAKYAGSQAEAEAVRQAHTEAAPGNSGTIEQLPQTA